MADNILVQNRISKILNEKGMTQKELATKAGIHPSILGEIVQNPKKKTKESYIAKISDALNIPKEELFEPVEDDEITTKNRVRQLREAKNWTQEHLAMEAELARSTLVAIEKNESLRINVGHMKKIALALGVSFKDLFVPTTKENGPELSVENMEHAVFSMYMDMSLIKAIVEDLLLTQEGFGEHIHEIKEHIKLSKDKAQKVHKSGKRYKISKR